MWYAIPSLSGRTVLFSMYELSRIDLRSEFLACLGSPVPCQVIWHAICRGCSCIAENKVFVFASRKRQVEKQLEECNHIQNDIGACMYVCTYVMKCNAMQ